jgi:hypothetical protein
MMVILVTAEVVVKLTVRQEYGSDDHSLCKLIEVPVDRRQPDALESQFHLPPHLLGAEKPPRAGKDLK